MKGKYSVTLCLLLALAAGLFAAHASHRAAPVDRGESAFQAKTTTRTGVVHLPKSADAVFPLFGPIREAEWAEGWEPHPLLPGDNTPREGMVFTTEGHGEEGTVWIISRLDGAHRAITYVTVIPGNRVGWIQIACDDGDGGASRSMVTYTLTALGPAGNSYIESFTEEAYARRMAAWEHALRYFLETGKRAHHHG